MPRELPLGMLMFLAHRAAEDRVFARLAEAGHDDITRAQGRLLAGMDEGGTRLVVLAERARVAKQTAVALVNRLERAGYVTRELDPSDGRARLVVLTERGRGLIPHARRAEAETDDEWTAVLGARRARALRAALDDLRDVVDPESALPRGSAGSGAVVWSQGEGRS